MDAGNKSEPAVKNQTAVERISDREIAVTRKVAAPARLVFEAWSKPELFKRWWVPKSYGMTLLSCELDVRTGGKYRLVFKHPANEQPMAFFGRYLDVVPNARIVWTNEEGGEGGAVTTVTFQERGGETIVVYSDRYPTKEALDEAMTSGNTGALDETFGQLEELLVTLGSGG